MNRIIYIPVYDGERKAIAIDLKQARYWNGHIFHRGRIFSAHYIAADVAGVVAYWQRDHKTMAMHKIAPSDLWKQ